MAVGVLYADKPRVAVSPFTADNDTTKKIAEMFMDGIEEELVKSKLVSVVDRQETQQILKEHKLQLTGATDQSTAVKIGKILNVSKIIFGKVSYLGTVVSFRVRAIDVETSEIIFTRSISVDVSNEASKVESGKELIRLIQDLLFEITGIKYTISDELNNTKSGNLTITVVSARDVPQMDMGSQSDVFAQVYVGDNIVGQTSTVSDNPNPIWNQSFVRRNYNNEPVKILFYDADVMTNELLGGQIFQKLTNGEYQILLDKNGQTYSFGFFTVEFSF